MTGNSTTALKPSDVQKGPVFTDQGTWAPGQRPEKKRTPSNVILAIFALGVLGMGGFMALVVSGANEVANSIEEDANKPGGTNNPLTIAEGKPFEVDGLDYATGWSIEKDALGDMDVKGIKVTNNRDNPDSAMVEIKLWKGAEVLALIDCTTESIFAGTTVELSCSSSDTMPKAYDKVTINDTF